MRTNTFDLILLIVLSARSDKATGNDDCGPQTIDYLDCCKGFEHSFDIFKSEVIGKCFSKFPSSEQPFDDKTPPVNISGSDRDLEMLNIQTCVTECIFQESGYLKDGKIEMNSLKKTLSNRNGDLETVVSKSVDKCVDSLENAAKSNLTCKSGAEEFSICLLRETFLNCPNTLWTNNPDCEELKLQVTKCPSLFYF